MHQCANGVGPHECGSGATVQDLDTGPRLPSGDPDGGHWMGGDMLYSRVRAVDPDPSLDMGIVRAGSARAEF